MATYTFDILEAVLFAATKIVGMNGVNIQMIRQYLLISVQSARSLQMHTVL